MAAFFITEIITLSRMNQVIYDLQSLIGYPPPIARTMLNTGTALGIWRFSLRTMLKSSSVSTRVVELGRA